jgi:3-oxoacyl-[acyl-carrier protein] reductase
VDTGLRGRRALVTGGSSGLGFAVCEALAVEGADLVIVARDPTKLEQAKDRLSSRHGVKITAVSVDMTERAELASLAPRLREMGGLDVLVLNSGGPPQPMRELLDETEHERWQDSYVQQLQAPLNVILEVTPLLVERGWGRVVAITSASVKQPMTRHAVSTIFRSGVHGALKHLANELAAKGVTVNAVGPAGILTERLAKNYDLEERAKSIPMKRLGKLEELAATVVFLASEQAGFITGQTIQVDGGMTAARL